MAGGACASNSGSPVNAGTTQIGDLGDGAIVYTSSKYFTASSLGESVSGSIGLTGGVYGESYTITFNPTTQTKTTTATKLLADSTGTPFALTNPAPCVVIAGSIESTSCAMSINPNQAAAGQYYLNPVVTNNATGAESTLAQIPLTINAGNAPQPGMLSIAVNANPIITSAAGVVTLSNSSGVESQTINLVSSFPGAIIEPTTCTVSSAYPTCKFNITGSIDSSGGTITASATGYKPATTPAMPLRMQWGTLSMTVTNTNGEPVVRLGESAVVTVTINGAIGVYNQDINIVSSNTSILTDASCRITGYSAPYNSCSVTLPSSHVGTTIMTATGVQHAGYTATHDASIVLLYAYAASFNKYITKCALNATGGIDSNACINLPTDNPSYFTMAEYITIQTFGVNTYAYVGGGDANVYKCLMSESGSFASTNCTTLTNEPAFSNVFSITFESFNGTTYAYVNNSGSEFYKCQMSATGDFVGNCTSLTNAAFPNGMSQTIFNSTDSGVFGYIANYSSDRNSESSMAYCLMSSTGDFTNCNNFNPDPLNPGIGVEAYTIALNTFGNGDSYIYLPAEGHSLFSCQLIAGVPTNCAEVKNNGATILGYGAVSFYYFGGIYYAYVPVSNGLLQCPTNPQTGAFTGACTSITNPLLDGPDGLTFHVFGG